MANIFYLTDDEQVLLERCRQQDQAAQRWLFDAYYKKMIPICLRYLKNEDDALDVLNQSFFKIFNKIHQYKAEAKLETWMKRIVINTTLDFLRSNKVYRKNFIQTDEFNLYGEPNTDDDTSIDEWWDAANSLTSELLFQLIENLPPATRTVFNMYVIDNFNHPQIAKKLKISTGTSKWHLSNARKILKEQITQLINNKKFNDGTKEAKNN